MEVYFVDVGKGTSHVIHLGESRAIVIDCGKSSGVLLQLLKRCRIEEIVRLVVSHNHDEFNAVHRFAWPWRTRRRPSSRPLI